MSPDKKAISSVSVLDKGHIEIVDMMGSDQRVVDAARVSTGSKSDPERDQKLIDYLMEHHHETPFEKIVFEFHVKCPIFVARQWVRHRIGSYNERSARYRRFEQEYFVPTLDTLPEAYDADDIEEYVDALQKAHDVYEKLLNKVNDAPKHRSRAREVFRGLLGTAFYTEFFWTVNFRSLMNFLKLRLAPGAQYEIRVFAEAIAEMIPDKIPWTYEAFDKFVLRPELGQPPKEKEDK